MTFATFTACIVIALLLVFGWLLLEIRADPKDRERYVPTVPKDSRLPPVDDL